MSRPPSLAALAVLPLLLAGCPSPPGPGRSVLLVTLDTTRADHLGAYGHPGVRTPVLDRLARGGVLFVQAIADVPVTLPSHTTLMTGIPALGHGVRYNADYRVGPDAVTLAERLAEAGWATGAVVSTLVLDSRFGIDQGFAHYDDDLEAGYVKHDESLYPAETHWLPRADRRAREAVDRSLAWLAGAAHPFLLWTHVYDPHFPFDPPPPWGRTHEHPYAAEIQFTDHELGRLLDAVGPETVVLVTADHGEGLDQHREDGHGIFVYDETIRVPLLVRAPGLPAGTVVAGQVRTVDVAPTVLELAGPAGTLGVGRSLTAAVGGAGPREAPAYSESIKTKLFYSGSGLKAVRTSDVKFVWAPVPEVYDLRADPGETRNLAAGDPERVKTLRARLVQEMERLLDPDVVFAQPVDLDEETAERLRSLGYLSGGPGRGPGTLDEELALSGNDPKDLVDVSMAAREIQNGFVQRGEQKLLRFFATARSPGEDPRMARLWAAARLNYAKIWFDRAEWSRAAEQYGEAVAVDPDYAQARWRWIYTLNLAGRAPEAEREAAKLLERHPNAWRVRLHRGLGLALLGRRDEARGELEAVVGGADEDAAGTARYYLDRLGTPEESASLRSYRGR